MLFFRLAPPLALLLLTGCQTSSQPASDLATRCSGAAQARCAWVNEIERRVTRRFDRADRYRGQRCDVTIRYDLRRGYQVLRTEGDEALCLKAWQAISSDRQLPAPPPEAPQQMMVRFRPG